MATEADVPAEVPAEDPAATESQASEAAASDGPMSALDELRGKVDGELGDAKTKCWQNIKMRTKMSILQAKNRSGDEGGNGSTYPALNRVADALGRPRVSPDASGRRMPVRGYLDRKAKIRKERLKYLASLKNHDLYKGPLGREVSRKILMQQKELLENLAAMKIQVCYRAYRGRVMAAKLRENLVIDLRTRLDEETKMRMAYEIKLNAFEEERKQMMEEANSGEEGTNPAMRALQSQIVSLENTLQDQVSECSRVQQECDEAKDDARSAAAETLALRDRIAELEKDRNHLQKKMHNLESNPQLAERARSASLSRGTGAADVNSPSKNDSVEDADIGSPEQMQAQIEDDVAAQLSDEDYDDDDAAKDEILYELSEKLDEAEAELERKEELMREMMDIINALEESQMAAEQSSGKDTEAYKELQEEHADMKAILEEKITEAEEMTNKCADLKIELDEAQAALAETKSSLEIAQGNAGGVAAELEQLTAWKSNVTSKLRAVAAKGSVSTLKHDVHELKTQAQALFGEQRTSWAQLSESAVGALTKLSTENTEVYELYKNECKTRKAIHNKLIEMQGNIRVFMRVRPALPSEDDTEIPFSFPIDDQVLLCGKRFEYDRVFKRETVQEQIFEDTAPLIVSALDGYNVCIFAYGQTGSGKTFTMEGPPENPGVNFRALSELFNNIDQRKAQNFDYSLEATILEIYNDEVHDLLDPAPDQKKMDVRQGPEGVFVPDLIHKDVNNADDIIKLMTMAKSNRTVCATKMNQESSRSHLILTIKMKGMNNTTNEKIKATLNLIDLAGSERVSKSDVSGQALKEAQNINKSLSYLGDVIAARANKSGHVPFRNCKLTYLLQDALSGDSKCLMFVCANPCPENAGESLCSLNFASRVRAVELGKAKKNISKVKPDAESGDSPSGPKKKAASKR